MSTLKVNAIEKKDADQTLTVKDAAMTGVTTIAGSPTVADMSNFTFPTGHIIQTRFGSSTVQVTTTNTTRALAVEHTITPQTGNDVLVTGTVGAQVDTGGQRPYLEILRTPAGGSSTQLWATQFSWGVSNAVIAPANVLDESPGGDGSTVITYSIKIWIIGGGGTLYANYTDGTGQLFSSIILQEIIG